VDEERLVRASQCPAAGFGLVDASARLPLAGCDEGPAPRLGGRARGAGRPRTLEVAIAQLCATFTADGLSPPVIDVLMSNVNTRVYFGRARE